jgi:hypothetical protein
VIDTTPSGCPSPSTTAARPVRRNAGRASSACAGVSGATSSARSRRAPSAAAAARADVVDDDHADGATVGVDDREPAVEVAGEADDHRLLDAEVARQGDRRCAHEAGDRAPREAALEHALLRFGAGHDDEEAAEERHPQAVDRAGGEREEPEHDEPDPERAPTARGELSGTPALAHSPPQQRARDAPTVQRERGQQVEGEDRGVDVDLVVDTLRTQSAITSPAARRSAPNVASRTAVTAGPASAKRSSSPGAFGSPVMRATPPSSQRSISSTSRP